MLKSLKMFNLIKFLVKFIIIYKFLILFQCSNGVNCDLIEFNINFTEYYRMPSLHKLDDYDRCMEDYPTIKSVFCFVDVTIAPNRTNDIWNYIERISADKKHFYRHDRLKRGLCLNWCNDKLMKLSDADRQLYNKEEFDRNFTEQTFHPVKFRNGIDLNKLYEQLINQCANLELRDQYGLIGFSEIEYCHSNQDQLEIDALDFSFLVICVLILAIVTLSTLFDFNLKFHKNTSQSSLNDIKMNDHYKADGKLSKKEKILVSFSIKRNWYRFLIRNESDEVKALNVFKFLLSWMVVLIHTVDMTNIFTTQNPQYMESNYDNVFKMLIVNGLTIVQTYFVISGFLLTYQYMKHRSRCDKFDGGYFWRTIVNRIFRLIPVYAFVILLNATWLVPLQAGPLWNHFNEQERNFCRENWWTNLLFINAYVNVNEPCMMQAWYLGTDFQLFVITLACLMIVWKYPKIKKILLWIFVIFSIVTPAVVTYVFKLEGIIMVYVESIKYLLWEEPVYKEMYIPTHTNTGSYLAGVIAGWLWFNIKTNEINMKKKKWFVALWLSVFPLLVGFLLSGFIFYKFEIEKPSIWISIYAIFHKNLWGILIAILIIGLASGVGWVIRRMANFGIWRPLGQLSYSVYLIHTFILRTITGNVRKPIYLNDLHLILKLTTTVSLSYLIGVVLLLCIEMPVSNLQKLLIKKRPVSQDNGEISHRITHKLKNSEIYVINTNSGDAKITKIYES